MTASTIGRVGKWAAQGPWTVKLEYLHVDFGSVSGTSTNLVLNSFAPPSARPGNVFTHTANLRSDIVRVDLNYQLR